MSNSNQWVMGEGSDNQFAWLENDEGHNVVCIERLAGNVAERVTFAGPSVTNFRESEILKHATTDSQWQAITDCIAAAPEMLAVLKRVVADAWGDSDRVWAMVSAVEAVLAKAEPVRLVKVRMTFEVDVVPSDTEARTLARARDEIVVCGSGKCVTQQIVYPTPSR